MVALRPRSSSCVLKYLFIGGPGGGTSPSDRGYFNPEKYKVCLIRRLLYKADNLDKIILFDQRGAGKSTPLDHLLRALLHRHSSSTILQKRLHGRKHNMGSC